MKAMILAAGRGERMRPLTEHTPKPLLKVAGKMLIQYHIERLAAAGVNDIVVNIAYLGQQIRDALGSGENFGVNLIYSQEPEPLETAGAILHALPLLGDAPFLLVNGDVWTDFPFAELRQQSLGSAKGKLVLVPNPEHNPEGDFSIEAGFLTEKTQPAYTFSGISLLHPNLVAQYPEKRQKFALLEVFKFALARQELAAEVYKGEWWDIGTVERLQTLDNFLR